MAADAIPLSGHVAFMASQLDVLCHHVETQLGAKCISAAAGSRVSALANRYALPSSELWFCAYGMPIRLGFQETDYLRIQFQLTGEGATHVGDATFAVTADTACICAAAASIDFGDGFTQLVWRIKRQVLARKLASLTGRRIDKQLEFNPVLRLDTASGTGLAALLKCMLITIACTPAENARLVLAELEQTLLVSLLCNGEHNFRGMLQSLATPVPPRLVRRAEEYMAANLDKPFDLASIAAETGASLRSIYRAFNKARGYSPAEFLRRQRLLRARELLQEGDQSRTITSIAFACGFSDASRFSKDFTNTFGESPSAFRGRLK